MSCLNYHLNINFINNKTLSIVGGGTPSKNLHGQNRRVPDRKGTVRGFLSQRPNEEQCPSIGVHEHYEFRWRVG